MHEDKSPLKNVIKDIIKRLETGEKETGNQLISLWKKIVGEDLFKHTRLTSLNRGRLAINVSDSSRLYDLTLKKRQLIKEINKTLKKKKIKEIRFRIGEV